MKTDKKGDYTHIISLLLLIKLLQLLQVFYKLELKFFKAYVFFFLNRSLFSRPSPA